MLNRLASLAFWGFIAVSSVLLFPVALVLWLVTLPFDRRGVALHRFTCFWASLYTWLNPLWPVTLRGRERIDPQATYVMVANHLSLLDILVLFRLFRHFKWVSKIEIFKVPFIGWNMRLNRYIPLKRGDRASVIEMLARCEETLSSGSSILMFPEGTRAPDGHLQAFKPGAFDLAIQLGLPILPVVVTGTADALPKHGFVLRGHQTIGIQVLEPIPPESYEGLDAAALAARTRAVYAAHLGEPPLPDAG